MEELELKLDFPFRQRESIVITIAIGFEIETKTTAPIEAFDSFSLPISRLPPESNSRSQRPAPIKRPYAPFDFSFIIRDLRY